MAYLTPSHISCGVKQLHGLHDHSMTSEGKIIPVDIESQLACVVDRNDYAMLIFSDHERLNSEQEAEAYDPNNPNHQGRRLAELIRENELGQLCESPRVVNPNTGNTIRMWTWVVDKDATRRLFAKYTKKKHAEKKACAKELRKKADDLVPNGVSFADVFGSTGGGGAGSSQTELASGNRGTGRTGGDVKVTLANTARKISQRQFLSRMNMAYQKQTGVR